MPKPSASKALLCAAGLLACAGCGGGAGSSAQPAPVSHWPAIRAAAAPVIVLTTAFATARVQPIAVDGWEDGICISRDGLHLYAVYAPADLLSFVMSGGDMHQAASYRRGPTLGMDLTTNPLGLPMWLHGDIIHAQRPSLAADFGAWSLSSLARPVTSEGAPQPTGDGTLAVCTTNEVAPTYSTDIVLVRHPTSTLAGTAVILPEPINTTATEDNPHIERLGASDLVLFFDSPDRPGGIGSHDIWFSTSGDDAATWSVPQLAGGVCTAGKEHQPHLWRAADATWWLYFTSASRGKDEIWRAHQTVAGDWSGWSAPELVVGAGTCAGVGEPTLTSDGDLSFVAVYEDPAGSAGNRFDADPWFAPHAPVGVASRAR